MIHLGQNIDTVHSHRALHTTDNHHGAKIYNKSSKILAASMLHDINHYLT